MGLSMRTARYRYTEWRASDDRSLLARKLYDHRSDPGENVNVAGSPGSGKLLLTLSRRLVKEFPAFVD